MPTLKERADAATALQNAGSWISRVEAIAEQCANLLAEGNALAEKLPDDEVEIAAYKEKLVSSAKAVGKTIIGDGLSEDKREE